MVEGPADASSDTVDADEVVAFVRAYAAVVAEHRVELIRLDAAIGDADHGENMDRGMRAAVAALDALDGPAVGGRTPAEVFKTVAMTLISKVGGAAGPLYGTAFLRAATALGGKDVLDARDVAAAFDAALAGIQARGKAEVGDKTMVDAWSPAAQAARDLAEVGSPLQEILRAAAQAAEDGMRNTVPLVARKGRASYLGERSAGHQDPGATSTWLLFRTLADCGNTTG
jgi:phosphoenolpyruvate---glycerone phosphotransferase subunit DhaL